MADIGPGADFRKLEETAPEEASRPRPRDKDRLRVFISYSRADNDIADQLGAALETCGFECFIDRQDISGGEAWKKRLVEAIVDADAVVFALSRASVYSPNCVWEVDESVRLGKRMLPVIYKSLGGASLPPPLEPLQRIYFYSEPDVPLSGFGNGLKRLVEALNTDFEWLREHTRYLQRATDWDSRGRPTTSGLLYGEEIQEARSWLARRPNVPNTPEPTALQRDFIQVSEREADARLSAERRWQAEREKARREAKVQGNQVETILENAIEITVSVQRHLDDQIILTKVFALFQSGADAGHSASMMNLGRIYFAGHGAAKDYVKAREWYEKAAKKGEPLAMTGLGILYNAGYGVAQDYAKAREWYEKAAETGDATAMTKLGNLYEAGHGVAQE